MHDTAFGIFHGVEVLYWVLFTEDGSMDQRRSPLYDTLFGTECQVRILVRKYLRWWTALIINFREARRVMKLMELRG
jgi:hypothetical protein